MSKYQVEVFVEIEIDDIEDESEDDAFNRAWFAVDELMQRAWDTDRGRHHVNQNWHFSMLEETVSIVEPEPEASPASD